MGKINVRLTINKRTGEYEARVIGHAGGSTCADERDEIVIEELLNAKIEDFGDMVIKDDYGKTCEYYEEKQAKQKPQQYKEGHGVKGGREEEKDAGLGFGV